jgi:uncharacterized membrane protein
MLSRRFRPVKRVKAGRAEPAAQAAVPRGREYSVPELDRGEARGTHPDGPPSEGSAQAARALGLIVAEGLSLGLCLNLLTLGGRSVAFVTANALAPPARASLLRVLLSVAAASALCGVLYLRRRGAAATLDLARRLSPVLVLGFLPPLLSWRIWTGRDLQFLVGTGLCALWLRSLVSAACGSSPLGSGPLRPRSAPRWLPGLLVGAGALAYAAFFAHHTIAYHRNVFSHSFDLGIFNNLEWNLLRGAPPFKATPAMGPVGSHLDRHATFFAYVLAPVYALHQQPETLLLVQAVLMGAAAIPLFLLARTRTGEWPAAVVALCYLMYPPLHGANLADFHFLSLAPFFLWTLLHLVEGGRRPVAAAAVFLLALSLREDVAASLVVLGVYLVCWGRRPRAGAAIALVSGLYFIAMKFVVMRAGAADESFLYAYGALAPPEDVSFRGALQTVLGNPFFVLGTLLEPAKLVYALLIVVPLALLPFIRPIGLLFAVPGVVFTLLSVGYSPFLQISFQYTAHWTGFLFVALVLNLEHLRRPRFPDDAAGGARLRAALAALAFATIVCSHQYGAVLQRNTVRAGFDRFRFGTTDEDRRRREELQALIATIPPRAKVAGSETVVPHVSSRPDAYTLRLGTYDAEYLLFSLEVATAGEPQRIVEALGSGEFGVVRAGPHFALARRGYDTTANGPLVARLANVEIGLPH